MWPFQKHNKRITISLTPQNITCSLIAAPEKNKTMYTLQAYKRTPLKKFEFCQAVVFNSTALKKHITSFLKSIKNKYPIAFSVAGPKIFEKIITVKTATPTINDFKSPELHNLQWNCQYLCPSQQDGFDFFVCGMKPEHLFSYQLLAYSCGINPTTITTQQYTSLLTYKYLQGKQFRQSQFSQHLLTHRYDINSLISADNIEKTFTTNPHLGINIQKEFSFLSEGLGLFLEGTQ